MTKKTNDSSKTIKLVVAGASIAAAAAAAYFFFGPDGKKHQRHVKAWAIKMKAEVIEKLEMAREMSEPIYREIVDSVAAEYAKAKKGDQTEISQLASDLKKHWKNLSSTIKSKS